MKRQLRSFFRLFSDPALKFGLFALTIALLIWMGFYLSIASLRDGYWPNLFVEFGGAIFDIIIFGVFLTAAMSYFNRKQEVTRQHEIIEDYKRWDSEEARFRLAGAIRRLNRKNVKAIDLSGVRLTDFSFSENGIGSLAGSTFYDGTWGEPLAEGAIKLKKVSFDHINCQSVQFSPFNPFSGLGNNPPSFAHFLDCGFFDADLKKSVFKGAYLEWSTPPPDSHFEHVDDDEHGAPILAQKSYGPFEGANLADSSFAEVVFKNADFRGAKDILEADFSGAKGLDTAIFDDDKTKRAILAKVDKKPDQTQP